MDKINTELLKGSTSTIVLTVLNRKEMYGYELIKAIDRESKGVFSLKEGTLYPILHQLEKEGAIESYWEDTPSARKRRYYRITRKGTKLLAKKTQEWRAFRALIDQFVGLFAETEAL